MTIYLSVDLVQLSTIFASHSAVASDIKMSDKLFFSKE
jgi:hypothetical protein